MGTCWNCDTEVTLQKDQTRCDKCGETLFYHCNSCKEEFKVENFETKEKLEECKLCGYFKCPHCGICFWNCQRYKWEAEVLKILAPEITQGKFPVLLDKTKSIVAYFETVKSSNERKECVNHIPITYAKGRIKSLLARRDGFRVKNEKDRQEFVKRIDEITEVTTGTKLTVTQSREAGSYGQEYRDAFNLLVCLGKLKITWQKKENSEEEYAMYERVDNKPCQYLNVKDLIINECPKCKTQYANDIKFCNKCVHKNKGGFFELKKRLNNNDTCQMYRGDFNGKH
jgi:hypothetical protein